MSDNSFKVKKGLTINPVDPAEISNPEAGDIIIDSTDNNKLKVFSTTSNNFAAISGAGSGTLNLLEDPSFESTATEGSITGGTASLNTTTVLPTPNNKSSLELNFNNVTGSYILEKNTGAQYDGVQGVISVWAKTAKTGVKLVPRINGADSTSLTVDIKSDNKWNEYVIPAVIGTTSFGFKIDVTASNAGSVFIDEASVGVMPATMTPEVAQAEYFGGLTAEAASNCAWSTTSTSYVNLSADADCNEFTEIKNIKKPSTKIPAVVIPAGSPSGTYKIVASFSYLAGPSATPFGCRARLSDGTNSSLTTNVMTVDANDTSGITAAPKVVWAYEYQTSNSDTTVNLQIRTSGGSCVVNNSAVGLDKSGFDVYYYPPKNKIYSNKSMGWYVDVNIGGANPSLGTSSVSSYTSISNGSLDMVINPGSQPAEIPCSSTNPSTGLTCSAGDEQIGVVFDVPSVGTYEVCVDFTHSINTSNSAASGAFTNFEIVETLNNSQAIIQRGKQRTSSRISSVNSNTAQFVFFPRTSCGVFKFDSVGGKTIRLAYTQSVQAAGILQSIIVADRASGVSGDIDIHITVKPFINNEQITASFKQIDDELATVFVEAHSSSTTIGTGNTTLIFGTEVFDTKNSYNLATGVFTAPFDGLYVFNLNGQTDGIALATTERVFCVINFGTYENLLVRTSGTGGTHAHNISGSTTAYMLAGQTAIPQCASSVSVALPNTRLTSSLKVTRIPSK